MAITRHYTASNKKYSKIHQINYNITNVKQSNVFTQQLALVLNVITVQIIMTSQFRYYIFLELLKHLFPY